MTTTTHIERAVRYLTIALDELRATGLSTVALEEKARQITADSYALMRKALDMTVPEEAL